MGRSQPGKAPSFLILLYRESGSWIVKVEEEASGGGGLGDGWGQGMGTRTVRKPAQAEDKIIHQSGIGLSWQRKNQDPD